MLKILVYFIIIFWKQYGKLISNLKISHVEKINTLMSILTKYYDNGIIFEHEMINLRSTRVGETSGRLLHLTFSWRCVLGKYLTLEMDSLISDSRKTLLQASTKCRRWLRNIRSGRYHSDCERFRDDGLIALSLKLEVHFTIFSLSRAIN